MLIKLWSGDRGLEVFVSDINGQTVLDFRRSGTSILQLSAVDFACLSYWALQLREVKDTLRHVPNVPLPTVLSVAIGKYNCQPNDLRSRLADMDVIIGTLKKTDNIVFNETEPGRTAPSATTLRAIAVREFLHALASAKTT